MTNIAVVSCSNRHVSLGKWKYGASRQLLAGEQGPGVEHIIFIVSLHVCQQERMDPLMGSVTDFIISDTSHDHQAHVVHLPDGGHVLYVDGYLIPEHTG